MRETLLLGLGLDGYSLVGRNLIPTESAVIDQPQQVALLKQRIMESKFPKEKVILHHYEHGEILYVEQRWDASIGQWRSFFERLLRDIAELTSKQRPDIPASLGPMKDVMNYLLKVGFFDQAEQASVGATWGFLCSGSHPGIKLEHTAHLAMMQALCFGQILVLKFHDWQNNAFKCFSLSQSTGS